MTTIKKTDSNIESLIRKKVKNSSKSNKKKIENDIENDIKDDISVISSSSSIESDIEVTICEWYSYNGKRCKRESKGKTFCKLHKVLVKDFKKVQDKTQLCSIEKEIKITPRSKEHVNAIIGKLNYDDCDSAEAYLQGGGKEDADITHDDYIELILDGTKLYYEPEKGQAKAKSIRLIFVQFCDNPALISFKDEKYCKDCYKKVSKKLGYPCIKLIKDQ